MSKIVKEIVGLQKRFGGEPHIGWLPPNAAQPQPTPIRNAVLDVRIEDDGGSFSLICESRNTPDSWDTWHETLADAEAEAQRSLGIRAWEWASAEDAATH
jgi:hypothetical protein